MVPATGADYFEIVAQATNDAIRDWDVRTGALAWPRGLDSLLGYETSAESAKIGFWLRHLHPDDGERIQNSLRLAFAGTASDEIGISRIDGGELPGKINRVFWTWWHDGLLALEKAVIPRVRSACRNLL